MLGNSKFDDSSATARDIVARKEYAVKRLCLFVLIVIAPSTVHKMLSTLSHKRSHVSRRALSGQAFADALAGYASLEREIGPLSSSGKPLQSFIDLGTENWMSHVPDDTRLSELSIPGTHDSCANVGGFFCETQDFDFVDQLRAGVRFLDIRCRPSGNRFAIHHGICFLSLFFEDILEEVRTFLANHPTETVLMRIKEEFTPTLDALSFELIWETYMNELGFRDLFVQNLGGIPMLGDVRGRVVVLSDEPGPRPGRSTTSYGLGWKRGPYTDIQDSFQVNSLSELAEKTELTLTFLEKASLQPRVFTINHMSATGVPLPGFFPRDIAETTNAGVYQFLGAVHGKTSLGILSIDYLGEGLISRVLRTNFGDAFLGNFRAKDQFQLFDEPGCTGNSVGSLDYPGPGGAVDSDASASEQLGDRSPRSIQLHGPVTAGTRLLAGESSRAFGRSGNSVISVLADISSTSSLCIEDLEQETVSASSYVQNGMRTSLFSKPPTSFRVERPADDAKNSYLSATDRLLWTRRFRSSPSPALGGPIIGMYCSGHNCKTRTLLQSNSTVCSSNQSYWTVPWVTHQCKEGHYVNQVDCSVIGCYFKLALHCVKTSCGVDPEGATSIREVHADEEEYCLSGNIVTGMKCRDPFSATLVMYCSKFGTVE